MRAFHENRMYGLNLPVQIGTAHNISFLAHWHNDVELAFVLDGSIRMGINSESRVLEKGDLAVCASGDIHYYDSREHESTILLVIFNPQLIGCPGGWPKDVRLTSPFLAGYEAGDSSMTQENFGQITAILNALLPEVEQKPAYYEMLLTGKLFELSGLILRHSRCEPANHRKDKRRLIRMNILQNVLDYLDANFMNDVTLEDAANHANMSLFHFSRYFKEMSGMNFTLYLNNLRVNHAEALILSTNKTMIDIALECGFTNVRTFNRVFKQVRNRTPSELR
ncbi:helix-turn-helix domain-containing protein [Paenibacillus sp. sgz500958]|uniref:helix-turn-helix transcriptional regulator n=1 Tax=Paenibacillus sp. sgz500958 TaxID=3242475 RepID=UPI0036D3A94B